MNSSKPANRSGNTAKPWSLAALVLATLAATGVSADTITLDTSAFGIYERTIIGTSNTIFSHATPDSLVRYDVGSPFKDENTDISIRQYFVYDLGQISGKITGATLRIVSPQDARSPNESDHYKLSAVATNISTLVDPATTGNASIFDDLNDGTLYGQTDLKADDVKKGTVINIDLGGALADLNGSKGGRFALAGSIDPLISVFDPDFLAFKTPYYFGNAQGSSSPAPQLILQTTPVPIPAAWVLFAAGGAMLSRFGGKKRDVTYQALANE